MYLTVVLVLAQYLQAVFFAFSMPCNIVIKGRYKVLGEKNCGK